MLVRAPGFKKGELRPRCRTNNQYNQTRGIGHLEFGDWGYKVAGRASYVA